MCIVPFAKLLKKIPEEASIRNIGIAKGAYLVALGTSDGKVIVYKLGSTAPYAKQEIMTSKSGTAYGAITALDVSISPVPEINVDGDFIIAATETGELHQFELIKNLIDES